MSEIPEAADLADEYDHARAAWKADRYDPAARRRFKHAQQALRDGRIHWRGIGEYVPTDNPGHREFVNVHNNDRS